MTVDLDAELRAALDEAVADVRPTDAVWRRIETTIGAEPERRAGHPARRHLVLAVAAALVVAVGAVALWQRDEAGPVVRTNPRPQPSVVITPAPTPVPTPPTSAGVGTSATVTSTPTRPTSPRPSAAVAMLADGRMVEVDLAHQRILRVLGTRWSVDRPPPTGDVAVWGGVDVDAGGRTVWFTDCCLPANGRLYRASLDNWPAQPTDIGRAKAVAVSPDSAWVARVGDDLQITRQDGTTVAHDADASARDADLLWWSPDGTHLAYRTPVSDTVPNPDHVIHLLRWDGRTLSADPGFSPVPGSAIRWDAGGRLVVLPGRPRGSRTSGDGAWTLAVDKSGGLHLLDADGQATPLLAGTKVVDADPIETEHGS